jgi:hypothetical protein
VLKKMVDWHTIKQAKNITIPEEQDIPRAVLRFPHMWRLEPFTASSWPGCRGARVVTRTFSDGWMDGRTMAAGGVCDLDAL